METQRNTDKHRLKIGPETEMIGRLKQQRKNVPGPIIHFLYAFNSCFFFCAFSFHSLICVYLCLSVFIFGFKLFFKPLRRRGAAWQRGQKWLLLPATITRRIFTLQRKQGFPSRW